MLSLFKLPEQCIYNKTIRKEDVFQKNIGDVISVKWYASIKPAFVEVTPVITEHIRYEEIQIVQIEIGNYQKIYDIAREVYKKIKYPCLLIFKYHTKYSLSTCHFVAGKVNYDDNILKTIAVSHWIYPDLLSDKADYTIQLINNALSGTTDIYKMYSDINYAVANFKISGATKKDFESYVHEVMPRVGNCTFNEITKYCTPYRLYYKSDRYERKTSGAFRYVYDYEDIWYCLMKCEETRKVIENRRIRDIEDLVMIVEMKDQTEEY